MTAEIVFAMLPRSVRNLGAQYPPFGHAEIRLAIGRDAMQNGCELKPTHSNTRNIDVTGASVLDVFDKKCFNDTAGSALVAASPR